MLLPSNSGTCCRCDAGACWLLSPRRLRPLLRPGVGAGQACEPPWEHCEKLSRMVAESAAEGRWIVTIWSVALSSRSTACCTTAPVDSADAERGVAHPTIDLRRQAPMIQALPGPWAVPAPDRKTTEHAASDTGGGRKCADLRSACCSNAWHVLSNRQRQTVESVISPRRRPLQTPSKSC